VDIAIDVSATNRWTEQAKAAASVELIGQKNPGFAREFVTWGVQRKQVKHDCLPFSGQEVSLLEAK